MEILVTIRTYNSYGGHATISLAGGYLQTSLPDLGDGIEEIDVTVCFGNGREPRPTLEVSHVQHAEFVQTLPQSRFLRKKRKLSLTYLSELGDDRLVTEFNPPVLDLFRRATTELVGQIGRALDHALKASDNVNRDRFHAILDDKLARLPATEEAFAAVRQEIKADKIKRRDAMDEWQRLGIDWDEFHPLARQILDIPFFWSCANDDAPHGNDTGADLLASYREWRPHRRTTAADVFLARLFSEWGMPLPVNESDPIARRVYDEAAIALPFAQLKVDGACDRAARDAALKVLDAKSGYDASTSGDAVSLLHAKLQSAPLLQER